MCCTHGFQPNLNLKYMKRGVSVLGCTNFILLLTTKQWNITIYIIFGVCSALDMTTSTWEYCGGCMRILPHF